VLQHIALSYSVIIFIFYTRTNGRLILETTERPPAAVHNRSSASERASGAAAEWRRVFVLQLNLSGHAVVALSCLLKPLYTPGPLLPLQLCFFFMPVRCAFLPAAQYSAQALLGVLRISWRLLIVIYVASPLCQFSAVCMDAGPDDGSLVARSRPRVI